MKIVYFIRGIIDKVKEINKNIENKAENIRDRIQTMID
jgi:hypothetical protein